MTSLTVVAVDWIIAQESAVDKQLRLPIACVTHRFEIYCKHHTPEVVVSLTCSWLIPPLLNDIAEIQRNHG